MGLPKINVVVNNGGLGRVEELDGGVPAIIVKMTAAPSEHAFGEVKAYLAYEQLPDELQKQEALQMYFKMAEGRKIYVMPVASTVTCDAILDKQADVPYAKRLLEAGKGEIAMITVAEALTDETLPAALIAAQGLGAAAAAAFEPVVFLLGAKYSAELPDLTQASYDHCCVLVSETGRELGLLIGKLAATPVQRQPGRVKDGSLPLTEAFVGEKRVENARLEIETVSGKGYVSIYTISGKAGYYFADAPMACSVTGDFAEIPLRRVINKLIRIAYSVYVNELMDEIRLETNGTLSPGVIKYFEGLIENAVNEQMTVKSEISACEAYMAAEQNVLATGYLTVSLKVIPLGYAKEITVDLGFVKSFEN